MNPLLIALVAAAGTIVIILSITMLNRAWGDFPGRISSLPSQMPPRSLDGFASPAIVPPDPAVEWTPGQMAIGGATTPGGLVPVTHPLVRRAILAGLERGGSPYALYFVRDGDELFLVPTRIADASERARAVQMFESLNSGKESSLPLSDMLKTFQDLTRTR